MGLCARESPIEDTIELLTPAPVPPISEVMDGLRWYFGPKAGSVVEEPAWLQCSNGHFSTELLLPVKWDLWVATRPVEPWSMRASPACLPVPGGMRATCSYDPRQT